MVSSILGCSSSDSDVSLNSLEDTRNVGIRREGWTFLWLKTTRLESSCPFKYWFLSGAKLVLKKTFQWTNWCFQCISCNQTSSTRVSFTAEILSPITTVIEIESIKSFSRHKFVVLLCRNLNLKEIFEERDVLLCVCTLFYLRGSWRRELHGVAFLIKEPWLCARLIIFAEQPMQATQTVQSNRLNPRDSRKNVLVDKRGFAFQQTKHNCEVLL